MDQYLTLYYQIYHSIFLSLNNYTIFLIDKYYPALNISCTHLYIPPLLFIQKFPDWSDGNYNNIYFYHYLVQLIGQNSIKLVMIFLFFFLNFTINTQFLNKIHFKLYVSLLVF